MLKFYIKPINACNLACKHCFVDHTKPRLDNYFERVSDFINQASGTLVQGIMHGGEPMLLPPSEIKAFYDSIKPEHTLERSIQTNLVYNLTDKKMDLFKDTFRGGIGTSYDITGRFRNDEDLKLWKRNVLECHAAGVHVSLCLCLTKQTIEEMSPQDVVDMCLELKVPYLILERVTGAPTVDSSVFPHPKQLDKWLLDFFNLYREKEIYNQILIPFFSTLVMNQSSSKGKGGNFCRSCETFTFTINSDGTIAGCPNDADFVRWGHLDDGYNKLIVSHFRQKSITCEKIRPNECYTCEHFDVCGGDCYKLEHFEDGECFAPKSIYGQIKKEGEKFYWDMLDAGDNQ